VQANKKRKRKKIILEPNIVKKQIKKIDIKINLKILCFKYYIHLYRISLVMENVMYVGQQK
jgi:hypothetical protein